MGEFKPENYIGFADREKKAKEMAAAIGTAREYIADAKLRYMKKKFRAKSKADAENFEKALSDGRFKCLDDYNHRSDIQDTYGYDMITESEMDRLEELWDEREALKENYDAGKGKYEDYVTKALDHAYNAVMEAFGNEIDEVQRLKKEWDVEVAKEDAMRWKGNPYD